MIIGMIKENSPMLIPGPLLIVAIIILGKTFLDESWIQQLFCGAMSEGTYRKRRAI
jgi:hypothetical protein